MSGPNSATLNPQVSLYGFPLSSPPKPLSRETTGDATLIFEVPPTLPPRLLSENSIEVIVPESRPGTPLVPSLTPHLPIEPSAITAESFRQRSHTHPPHAPIRCWNALFAPESSLHTNPESSQGREEFSDAKSLIPDFLPLNLYANASPQIQPIAPPPQDSRKAQAKAERIFHRRLLQTHPTRPQPGLASKATNSSVRLPGQHHILSPSSPAHSLDVVPQQVSPLPPSTEQRSLPGGLSTQREALMRNIQLAARTARTSN